MSKKTEKIELRVSPELKERLSAHSAKSGESISETIRSVIEQELSDATPSPSNHRNRNMANKTGALKQTAIAAAAVAALGVVASGFYQQPAMAQATVRVAFADLDRNEDGVISREEFDRPLGDEFVVEFPNGEEPLPEACAAELADMDKEFTGADFGTDQSQEFSRFDADANTEISFDEFRTRINEDTQAEFMSMDKNGDGALSRQELETAYVTESVFLSEACVEAVGVPELVAEEGYASEDVFLLEDDIEFDRLMFAALDEDRDGQISLQEYLNN